MKRRMRCVRGRIFREGETFAWYWFHKELFVVKISIKGKDESSFHYKKKESLNPALNSLGEEETLLLSFSKLSF